MVTGNVRSKSDGYSGKVSLSASAYVGFKK